MRKQTSSKADADWRGMYDFSVLKTLRDRTGWTLAEVSSRCGVSVSGLSRLERNLAAPEMETLFRLSRVFEMTTTDLLSLAEVSGCQKTKSEHAASGPFVFDRIGYGNLRATAVTARAGSKLSRPEVHRDDYEVCWVRRGKLRVALPHETHLLRAGDAIQFDALHPHTYEAIDDCEALIMHLTKARRF